MAGTTVTTTETFNSGKSTLEKVESFLSDTAYKEAIENSVNYNMRLCIERRLRLPFIDTQTGVAQNHSQLFMHRRQRIPGLFPGQIYSYPRQRWRKKRRQYLSMNARAFARAADHLLDGSDDVHSISQMENPALQDTDSKDSQLLKDEVSKEWFYDEADMLEMDAYDEPDPDSDLDYEETYSKRRRGKRGVGRGRSGTDSPSTPGRRKGAGRGRKKAAFDPTPGDPDKPFSCERTPGRRGRQPNVPPGGAPLNVPPMGMSQQPTQAPPVLPPNLPPQQTQPLIDDPTMPVLLPEKNMDSSTSQSVPSPADTTSSSSVFGMDGGPKLTAPNSYCDFCLGDVTENKKTGGQEELVSCADCGRSGKNDTIKSDDKNFNEKKMKKKKS